ncbi:hypothetical protein BWQ96_09521 [Gracilariopsis chorda]|uniref:BZIP domain-containing protein n=1 Tax=Gracilariopsis chorda TaxID=448386 RepID=A0A2V3IF90_9FLOR|nr:hypothetical protein BWQ96_09521 [Gracilariopsis chorda]|eukprot:PXF40759.1 hypothetical protein BWQ96_09521 [Gracilariopsis chorda]
MSRTRSVPHHAHPHTRRSAAPPSAAPSDLRLTTPASKRLSRTRSGLTPTARRMLASAAAAAAAAATTSATNADHPTATTTATPTPPSPLVLRPLSANPCLRDGVELASHALTALSRAHRAHRAHRAPSTPEPDRMLLDDPVHDASCSSHDNNAAGALAGPSSSNPVHHSSTNNAYQLQAAGGSNQRSQRSPPPPMVASTAVPVRTRSRTTPDAKRAQNRESAKRFRMAQKKRWEQLQNTVTRKDAEIARLKRMLQEVTNTQEQTTRQSGGRFNSVANIGEAQRGADCSRGDALSRAELELFVKLLWAPPHHSGQSDSQHSSSVNGADGSCGGSQQLLPPMAANLGCLHRVIVAKVDGSVLGIRHQNDQRGRAMGAEVGGCIWEHVDSADSLHLRCSIVHASKLAAMFDGHLNVFSYRRRKHVTYATNNDSALGGGDGGGRVEYIRMKGCVYPLPDDSGAITRVLLAEFIEL